MRCSISASDLTPSRLMDSFCRPASAMWVWASLKPGIANALWRSTIFVFGPFSFRMFASEACGQDFSVSDGEGGDLCRGWRGVVGAEMSTG